MTDKGIIKLAPVLGTLTATSWTPPKDMTLEQWLALGKRLVSAEKNVQWVLGAWWIYGCKREYGDGRALAEQVGIDYGTIFNYASVVRAFEISRRRENLSFGHHQAVAALPASQQDQWLKRAERDDLSVARLRQALRVSTMKDRRLHREQEFAEGTKAASKALGKKLYGVILADPPWRYDSPPMGDVARLNEQHYPTMALDEIKALPVPAAENCVLFLWATMPRLDYAMAVIPAWGFAYKSAVVWVKDKAGTGYWLRGQAELLLICRRGDVPAPAPGDQLPAVIEAPRGRHSEKPDIFAEEIERLFPDVPKLEMFARTVRFGWDAWGNEVSAVELESSPANVAPVEPKLEASVKDLFLRQAQKRQKQYRFGRALKWKSEHPR
jgi:N6-adenosine-specific RNA methylase IME4